MPMKPLAGLFLALACVLGIASTGAFELAYGDPDLGVRVTVGSWLSPLRRRSGHFLSRFAEQTGLNPQTKPIVTFTIPTHPSAPMARLRIAAAALAVSAPPSSRG